jgi:hypothetical protein
MQMLFIDKNINLLYFCYLYIGSKIREVFNCPKYGGMCMGGSEIRDLGKGLLKPGQIMEKLTKSLVILSL